MTDRVRNLSKTLLSDNWYTLHNVTFDYRNRTGQWHTLQREAYDRGNGATVLLFSRLARTVILTRQFRLPTYINGNSDGMMIEACAGLLDGHTPHDCVIKEAEEETGYKIDQPKLVLEAYMSPGAVTEKIYFYVAEYDAANKISTGGGLDSEQEDIEVLELDIDVANAMIADGTIRDAKTIMLLQYAILHKLFD